PAAGRSRTRSGTTNSATIASASSSYAVTRRRSSRTRSAGTSKQAFAKRTAAKLSAGPILDWPEHISARAPAAADNADDHESSQRRKHRQRKDTADHRLQLDERRVAARDKGRLKIVAHDHFRIARF